MSLNEIQKVHEEAAALQRRFAAMTREQMKVSSRLSLQRNELLALCNDMLDTIESLLDMDHEEFRRRRDAAQVADPEG